MIHIKAEFMLPERKIENLTPELNPSMLSTPKNRSKIAAFVKKF